MMLCKALQREASEWAATPLKSLTLFKREKMPHSSYTNTLSPIALLSLYLHAFIYFSTLAEDSLKHPQDSFGPQESSTWRVRWFLYNQASSQTTYIFICLHLLLMKKQIRYNKTSLCIWLQSVLSQSSELQMPSLWNHRKMTSGICWLTPQERTQNQTFTTNNLEMWKAFKSMAGTENEFSFII